jgi:diaminopimelate decarboxylase
VKKSKVLGPQDWGLEVGRDGELVVAGCSTVDLARTYGTPLHVVNESRLEETAASFIRVFNETYPREVSVHYAFKCNSVPGVVRIVQRTGMKAEVMSEFELSLALKLGYRGEDIIVNGPHKPDGLLRMCVGSNVRFVVADSLPELRRLQDICDENHSEGNILLRVNPGFVPRGMSQGTATGSRRGCAFGLDLEGGEVDRALDELGKLKRLRFRGLHFHIGTGIRRPGDYRRALARLEPLVGRIARRGLTIEAFDVGGGFGAPNTREMTTGEMLAYQGWHRLPAFSIPRKPFAFEDFARETSAGLSQIFPGDRLPELLTEPGRCIASSNQILLLTVSGVKERPGVGKWLITDGGLGTVSLPTYYEYHEVFLCNDVALPRTEKVTIVGPVCFAADTVYTSKPMPEVHPGDVLAVMDSGAYFTAMESSFGFPHPAIVAAARGSHRLLRSRETFREMVSRDGLVW